MRGKPKQNTVMEEKKKTKMRTNGVLKAWEITMSLRELVFSVQTSDLSTINLYELVLILRGRVRWHTRMLGPKNRLITAPR